MQTILLVEDDTTIAGLIRQYLVHAGYEVSVVADGSLALAEFERLAPDLVVLDLNLPGMTGFEICPAIRSRSDVPILVLSARSSEDDKVTCLELGADDYVPKPFSARELVARIGRHLVRAGRDTAKSEELRIGPVTISFSSYQAFWDEEEIRLTKTEFEILAHLFLHAGDIVARTTLMKEIIGYDHYLSDRTIDTHIKNLRKKFEGALDIETVRAVGYRLLRA